MSVFLIFSKYGKKRLPNGNRCNNRFAILADVRYILMIEEFPIAQKTVADSKKRRAI